eukprot:Opistho-2@34399
MRKPNDLPKAIGRQVSLATAALAARRSNLLIVPRDHSLDGRAENDKLDRCSERRGICVLVLDIVECRRKGIRAREERCQRPLLQLVGENGRVADTALSDSKTRCSVACGDGEGKLCRTEAHGRNADAAAEQLISNGKEASAAAVDLAREHSGLGNIRVCVEERLAGNADVFKEQLAVVDTVAAHLVAHVLNADTLCNGHVVVAHARKEGVDALLLSIDLKLSKHNDPLGVDCAVGDPVLLGKGIGRVDDKLARLLVVLSSRLHLNGVVAIAELGEAKASDFAEVVDAIEELAVVALRAKLQNSAAKKVPLHGELGCHGAVGVTGNFVRSVYAVGVGPEILHGKELLIGNLLKATEGDLTLFLKGHCVLGDEDGILEKVAHLRTHFVVVVVDHLAELSDIKAWLSAELRACDIGLQSSLSADKDGCGSMELTHARSGPACDSDTLSRLQHVGVVSRPSAKPENFSIKSQHPMYSALI